MDVNSLYFALKEKLIQVLSKDATNPPQELLNANPLDLMEKVENLAVAAITEIKIWEERQKLAV